MVSSNDIDEQLNLANEGFESGTKFPGMSYEEGVKAALEWITGVTVIKPMDD